jgi:hypothetical protein
LRSFTICWATSIQRRDVGAFAVDSAVVGATAPVVVDVLSAEVGTAEVDVAAVVEAVDGRFPERAETATIVATMAATRAKPRPIVRATMGDLRVLM